MVYFFRTLDSRVIAVDAAKLLGSEDVAKLEWLFGDAKFVEGVDEVMPLKKLFVGPRREMITPWSTNAVEIAQNMGIDGVVRMEEFDDRESDEHDPMLQSVYELLDQGLFVVDRKPEPVIFIDDVRGYNRQEGLALSEDELLYLEELSRRIGRRLTDSELFGFSQVNSEHCRHKIFNGTFIIDGEEKSDSLFALIKKTAKANYNRIVSAYKDNVTFILGPRVEQFAPASHDRPDYFAVKDIDVVISLKAETHNFPTTVEPFNGAATGTGGEIRDRMAGGRGSLPMAGTAVYMTSYPRLQASGDRQWERGMKEREWLYQSPRDILIKASNGASDFGNKFGQPLICGSVLTFEHFENGVKYGFDKVIMLAGGVGFGKRGEALKDFPEEGDVIVVVGGDNYRIGMGGGAVSSVDTGKYGNSIELNAVQRANPEMQKRAFNAIRAMVESDVNPIVSIHDHGAGGHLNCLSELVEEQGGRIDINKLPVGDPTLSDREIAGNESQERMGLVMKAKDVELLRAVAERERAPMYEVGEITGDDRFTLFNDQTGVAPIDLAIEDMLGKTPKTVMRDVSVAPDFEEIEYDDRRWQQYLHDVLRLESVACKDWLTNKVDRSVTGKIAMQQCVGPLQLPLNNLGVVALDYKGREGIATSIGHAPVAALIDAACGSRVAVAEALTNMVWAPLTDGLKGVSLSANWMWPCRNRGEDARLYEAVEALSKFVCEIGVNVPTGKDSLSMTQKYPDGDSVVSPGTVIVSSVAPVSDVRGVVSPLLVAGDGESVILYIDFSKDIRVLGGSAFSQIINRVGMEAPDVQDSDYFVSCFNAIQELVKESQILAGHDISSGGLITTLLEMTFAEQGVGMEVDLSGLGSDVVEAMFAENVGVVIQVRPEVRAVLRGKKIDFVELGRPIEGREFIVRYGDSVTRLNIDDLRNCWFETSFLMDKFQSGNTLAIERFHGITHHDLKYKFPEGFTGKLDKLCENSSQRPRAAIIREKGSQCDREMAYMMYMAGFDVKDVHTTDLMSGRETLEDVNMIVFVGGFSNSDVLGSAKGWAGALLYSDNAKRALDSFYEREDTLSIGVCNGCQLMVELNLICPEHGERVKMLHNDSHKLESGFLMVDVLKSSSVVLKSLEGSKLGIWVAHGEGKFYLPLEEREYDIAVKYSYDVYPANPNGSPYNTAAICSADGRHLAIMPHFERAFLPWQWAYYPKDRKNDEVSPWIEIFVNAKRWIEAPERG